MTENKFKIDFFELMFLAEACIPPQPIARSMFWDNMIDKYYHDMTNKQRAMAYDWIRKATSSPTELLKHNLDNSVMLFLNRYNPNNQYIVTDVNGEKHTMFLHRGEYRTSTKTYIPAENIKEVEPDTGIAKW